METLGAILVDPKMPNKHMLLERRPTILNAHEIQHTSTPIGQRRDMEEKLSREEPSHTPKGMDNYFSAAPEEVRSALLSPEEAYGISKSPEDAYGISKSPEEPCRILKCESFAVRL